MLETGTEQRDHRQCDAELAELCPHSRHPGAIPACSHQLWSLECWSLDDPNNHVFTFIISDVKIFLMMNSFKILRWWVLVRIGATKIQWIHQMRIDWCKNHFLEVIFPRIVRWSSEKAVLRWWSELCCLIDAVWDQQWRHLPQTQDNIRIGFARIEKNWGKIKISRGQHTRTLLLLYSSLIQTSRTSYS